MDESTKALQRATFAAGCFWRVQLLFQRTPGVVQTLAGFTDVSNEAVLVEYDPSKTSYRNLLEVYWGKCEPSIHEQKSGDMLRSGIYYHNAEQEQLARASLAKLKAARQSGKAHLEILPAKKFYPATDYHQEYLSKRGY